MQSSHRLTIPFDISDNQEPNEFPWVKYKITAVLIGSGVSSALFYSFFLGGTAIRSERYLFAVEDGPLNNFLLSLPLAIPLAANLAGDYLCVPLAKDASAIALTKISRMNALLDKSQASYTTRGITKAIYYSSMVAAWPSYSALSSADGVGVGWLFGDIPGIVYPSAAIFALSGTVYYHMLLNNKRADHIVTYVNKLKDCNSSLLLDLFTQPLMAVEALNEVSITIAFRTTLAVFTIFAFLTETLNINSGNALILRIMATTGLSSIWDTMTTRTKGAIEQHFKYKELKFIEGWITLSRGTLLKLTRENLSEINAIISKKELGFDFLLSSVRGMAIAALCNSYGMNLNNTLAVGSVVFTHALYAKWMMQFCEAVIKIKETAPVLQEAIEQKESDQAQLFNNIVARYDSVSLKNKIFWLAFLARIARFVAFPVSIATINQELQDNGVFEKMGMEPLVFQQVLALWALIGIPYFFANEQRLYQTALEDALPEQIARISMEHHHPYVERNSRCGRISGYARAFFRPAETYNKNYLIVEEKHLDAEAIQRQEEIAPRRKSICSMCVIS